MTVKQLIDTLSRHPGTHDVVVKILMPDVYDDDGGIDTSAHYVLLAIKGTRHELKQTVLETD